MRVPDHAAVASTVELVRERIGHKPAGFTNALMRRIAERDLDAWMDLLDASQAVRFSHPAWIVDELARALGRPDELEALLAADNERPRVTLVARPGLSTVDELAGSPTLSPLGVALESGDPGAIPAVRDGRAGRAGRRFPAGRAGPDPSSRRGPRRALARPVRRTRRQGGPARGAGQPARCSAAGQRTPATPRPAGRPGAASDGWRRGRGGRHPTTVACGLVRPRARRRAVLGTRCAPAPTGEPLATTPGGRRGPRAAAARAAGECDRLGTARGSGALRDLLAGGRRDGRGGARTCWPAGATYASRMRLRSCPRPTTPRRPTSTAPSSCGRTGTAPTRCSWRCCAGSVVEDGR